MPSRAMVLAAGMGQRMRPLTDRIPKPLVPVLGRPLIDRALDRLAAAGVEVAVVNLHHFADALEAHLARRTAPRIALSDERALLLETGGGIAKALPLLGDAPFLLVNADSLWIDAGPNLERLARAFDAARMDACLLLAPKAESLGFEGRGDYELLADGRLRRRGDRAEAPYVYAGTAILAPALFTAAPPGPFPLARLFNRAEEQGRLFGLRLQGTFLHVGTPEAIASAEDALRRASAD